MSFEIYHSWKVLPLWVACLCSSSFDSNYRQLLWFIWSCLHALHYYLIKIVLGSMSPQKIIYVIIHLLEDEQELSLGMLIRPKRIHNFCLCHAYIAPLLHVLLSLLYHFKSFSGLTYWQDAQCQFLFSACFWFQKSSRKNSRKSPKLFRDERSQEPEGRTRRPNRGPKRPLAVAQVGPAPRGGAQPSDVSRRRLFALFILEAWNFQRRDPFPETRPEAPPPPKTLKRGFCRPAPAPWDRKSVV